ncbi:MAG: hypothetical protein JNL50_01535, partial [Phycisphaerae bacterium]|nr:hypothetical protein [Phycisphaerae bacterium]
MSKRELLSGLQGAMSDKLCKEYQTALREESRPAGAKRVDATWMAKFTYNNKAHEALIAIGRARAMAVAKASEVLPGSGLETALVGKLVEGCKGAPADVAGRAALFVSLGKDLSIEQRRAWL